MDRGAWWATVHGVTESDMTEHAPMHTPPVCRHSPLPHPKQHGSFSKQVVALHCPRSPVRNRSATLFCKYWSNTHENKNLKFQFCV